MVATTIDQVLHLALQKHEQYCSAKYSRRIPCSCLYSIRGDGQIKGWLKRMKKNHILPERAGQTSFRKTSGLARQGLKRRSLSRNNLDRHHDQYSVSCRACERFHLHHYYHV